MNDDPETIWRTAGNGKKPQPRSKDMPNPGGYVVPLDIIDPGQWDGREPPPRPWLVPGLIPKEEVTLLYGSGGEGKSRLALQLMVSLALRRQWIGLDVEPVKSLYFSCEDNANEIWRRLARILEHYNGGFSDISGQVGIVDRARELDNALMAYREPDSGYGRGSFETTPMYQSLYHAAISTGAGLVVVDSLYNAFGGNENVRSEANGFLNAMARMALDLNGGDGGTVLVLAHPSRAGRETGEGGVTAWSDAARARLQLRRASDDDADDETRELVCRKLNFGKDGGIIRLRWDDGVFVPADPSRGLGFVDSLDRAARERQCQDVFLDLLQRRNSEGRPVSHKPRSGNFAPTEFAKHPNRQGYRKSDFERAMERLFDEDRIQISTYGRPSRPYEKIIPANERTAHD